MRRSQSPPCAHFVWSHELPPPLKGANGVAELPWWSRTLYGLRVGATTPAGAACDVTATGVASTGRGGPVSGVEQGQHVPSVVLGSRLVAL